MMRAGTDTNSLVNHIHSRATIGQPTPVVGMGATELCWTDRHALTIVEVIETKKGGWIIGTTRDRATVVGGEYGSEKYEYETVPGAHISYWRAEHKDAGWRAVCKNDKGRWVLNGSGGIRIGEREEYRDPSF